MNKDFQNQFREIDKLDIDDINKSYMKADVIYPDDDEVISLIMDKGERYGFIYISHLMSFLELNDPYLFLKAKKRINYKLLKLCYKPYPPKKYSPSRRMYKDCFELLLDENADHDIIDYLKAMNGEDRLDNVKAAIRRQMKAEGKSTLEIDKDQLIDWLK